MDYNRYLRTGADRAIAEKVCEFLQDSGYSLRYVGHTQPKDSDSFFALDTRNRLHVVVGYITTAYGFQIRGIIRRKTRRSRLSWLCNGQASEGVQVAHWREGECVWEMDAETVQMRWREGYGEDWRETVLRLLKGGIFHHAERLTALATA